MILPAQYISGYKLKLVYMIPHPQLYLATDKLSDSIPLERVVYPATRDCFEYLALKTRRKDWDMSIRFWNERTEQARQTRQIFVPRRTGKVGLLPDNYVMSTEAAGYYPGDRTPR